METALDFELKWRMQQWEQLKQSPNWPHVKSDEIRSLNIYAGQAGVFRDARRTSSLLQHGITVAIRNTAGNYSDEISDNRLFYSYPKTLRKGQDQPEIQSLKNAMFTQLPVFVLSDAPNGRLEVRLGWIEGCEDAAEGCLVKLDTAPEQIIEPRSIIESAFQAKIQRSLSQKEITRIERDPKFKFNALTLYRSTCAVTDITVERMLDAAHIIPVSEKGSDHPRNSLLLNAAVHRTFDSHYWGIEPETLSLATRKVGPTLDQMKIRHNSLRHLELSPHPEALEYRWESFLKSCSEQFVIAK